MNKLVLLSKDKDYKDIFLSHFENSDFKIEFCDEISKAEKYCENNKVDIVLCDLSFGSVSIVQVAQTLRKYNNDMLIVAIGDCFGNQNLSTFIDSSVSEFICKKADLSLTEARLVNLLKNRTNDSSGDIEYVYSDVENIKINKKHGTIYHNSDIIHMTQIEFDLLLLFLENKNIVLDRNHILEKIWGERDSNNTRKVDTFIKNLRQKLNLKCIRSIRGQGYKWVE